MPDLGKYADSVLLSYAVSLILLAGLCLSTWRQSKRAKRALAKEEQKNG